MEIRIQLRRLIEFVTVGILIIAVGYLSFQYWRLKPFQIQNQEIIQSMQNQNQSVNQFLGELAQVKSLSELDAILVKYGVKK